MDFYEKVEDLCKARGIARSKMCDDLGISRSAPTTWKQNGRPRNSTIKKITEYFGVPVDYFEDETTASTSVEAVRIPVLGRVAAGAPFLADEDIIDWEEIPREWLKKGEYFGLKIRGQSMEPRIYDGDVVIVRKQDWCENGKIAIVLVNGEDATCKCVYKEDDGLILQPINPLHPNQKFTAEAVRRLPVQIIGVVVESRSRYE